MARGISIGSLVVELGLELGCLRAHLLESRGCRTSVVEILVGVVDSGKTTVGRLDLLGRSNSVNLQRLVVVEGWWWRHLANG